MGQSSSAAAFLKYATCHGLTMSSIKSRYVEHKNGVMDKIDQNRLDLRDVNQPSPKKDDMKMPFKTSHLMVTAWLPWFSRVSTDCVAA